MAFIGVTYWNYCDTETVFTASKRLFKEIIAMKDAEIDATKAELSSNSCDSIQLEETVISLANGYLKEMKHHCKYLRAEEDDFLTTSQKLTALVEIAYLANSGLSEAAGKSLLDIDQQATKLIADLQKVGAAINANCSPAPLSAMSPSLKHVSFTCDYFKAPSFSSCSKEHLLNELAARAEYWHRQLDGSYSLPQAGGQVAQILEMAIAARLKDLDYL